MQDSSAIYFIVETNRQAAGIVRFDKSKENNCFTIGINIAPEFRGKGLSCRFLTIACGEFFRTNNRRIDAYIKEENIQSIKSFEKAGFRFAEETEINGNKAFKYELTKK